jgi:group I intron endonuclease
MRSTGIPHTPGIYRITCTVNLKMYIGSAVSLYRRWKEHRGELRRNIHRNPKLQNAWNKYGEHSFTFEVIELVLIPELLTMREQHWLDKFKPFGHKGFNVARVAGSALGLKRTPETLERKRIASTGKKHSEATRALISLQRLNRSPADREHLRRIQPLAAEARRSDLIVISPDGTEYFVHGIEKFCREHKLQSSHLVNVARGKYKDHKGWKARFPENKAR